ncbi:MAG: enoyl-CoA hydratase/isomerase family protein [Betaproteobacteria bacterium]|nr:MAG: enoyl-CoA hydratase/isomerase family protein [Betaproteobacteria bacterium]
MTSAILLARDGAVATLTLNRPASLNALDPAMMDALVEHTAALAADDALRCVVIRGAGRHFMAGGDIRHFAEQLALVPADRQSRFTRMIASLHAAIEQLQRMPQRARRGRGLRPVFAMRL